MARKFTFRDGIEAQKVLRKPASSTKTLASWVLSDWAAALTTENLALHLRRQALGTVKHSSTTLQALLLEAAKRLDIGRCGLCRVLAPALCPEHDHDAFALCEKLR